MALQRTLILTSPMATGEDVETAQLLLKKHGDYAGKVSGHFDILSAQASYRAQFRLGYARPHQAFGPSLERLLTEESKPTAAMKKLAAKRKRDEKKRSGLRLRALAEMKKLIGTTEHPPGSNKTIVGEFYGAQDEWCAMGVTMAYVKAGSTGFAKGSRWSFVPYIVAAARAGQYGLTVTTDPKPGDLVCFDVDNTNFTGHTNHIGMFEKATGQNTFQTIEANISDTCKRMSHSRNSPTRMVFVHASK